MSAVSPPGGTAMAVTQGVMSAVSRMIEIVPSGDEYETLGNECKQCKIDLLHSRGLVNGNLLKCGYLDYRTEIVFGFFKVWKHKTYHK